MTLEEYKQRAKEDEDWTPGWEAIETAFSRIYTDQKPRHYATNLVSRANLGGDQYLDGYSVYTSPRGYYHIVSYGMSELYVNEESFGGEWSGWGYEMTFKLASQDLEDPKVCLWTLDMLANLAFFTNTRTSYLESLQFVAGDSKPLDRSNDSLITGLAVIADTEVESVDTPHGRLEFLQLVGLTQTELEFIAGFKEEADSRAALEKLLTSMKEDNPYLITDMQRKKSYV